MQIILTRDLNPKKGFIQGAIMNWPRSTITQMSRTEGTAEEPDHSWYKTSANLTESLNRVAQRSEPVKKRGPGRPRKTEVIA